MFRRVCMLRSHSRWRSFSDCSKSIWLPITGHTQQDSIPSLTASACLFISFDTIRLMHIIFRSYQQTSLPFRQQRQCSAETAMPAQHRDSIANAAQNRQQCQRSAETATSNANAAQNRQQRQRCAETTTPVQRSAAQRQQCQHRQQCQRSAAHVEPIFSTNLYQVNTTNPE